MSVKTLCAKKQVAVNEGPIFKQFHFSVPGNALWSEIVQLVPQCVQNRRDNGEQRKETENGNEYMKGEQDIKI